MVFKFPTPKKETVKKGAKVAVGATGVILVGVAAYWIWNKFFRDIDEGEPIFAEEEFVQQITIISLENIAGIAADVSLSEAEKIAIFEQQLNAQFTEMDKARVEIQNLEAQKVQIDQDIIAAEAAVAIEQIKVDDAFNELEIKKAKESDKYNAWIKISNQITDLKNEKSSRLNSVDKCFKNCGSWINAVCWAKCVALQISTGIKIGQIDNEISKLEGENANRYNEYLDASQQKKTAENDYNAALGVHNSFKESNLNPLLEKNIALINSITTWRIAFTAAEIVVSELQKLLGVA